MATAEYKATVGAVTASASSANLIGNVITLQAAAASNGTDGQALANAIATAVADGASPTQAHVTAIDDAWTTYKADIDAVTTATAALTADLSLYIGNVSNVGSMNKLRNALKALELCIRGSNLLQSGDPNPRSP
jgi:hypothetical protein